MATEIKWTDEQESAINYPSDSSACVSAAAGSGKTALLVERVVRLIRGNEAANIPPVSADKFAVMTFTRNAADEFRTRMTRAIDEASRNSGENAIPREQLIKFRSSVVSTIDRRSRLRGRGGVSAVCFGAPAGPHRQEAQRLRQAAVADCRAADIP